MHLACRLAAALFAASSAVAGAQPAVLQPQPPASAPVKLERVQPRAPAEGDFVVRTRHVLEVARRHPAPSRESRFEIGGVRYWPASPVTGDALALLGQEAGRFRPELRDALLACRASVAAPPADAQHVVLEVKNSELEVPVFLGPAASELPYLELSLDKPGAPVVLTVVGGNGVALRVTTSPRTRLAAVHLQTGKPGIVLGVDPERVSQVYRGQGRDPACLPPAAAARGAAGAERYVANGPHQVAIGQAVAVRRDPPRLGDFLDLEMPAPHNYGIVALVALGYLQPVKARGAGTPAAIPGGFLVRKPFRIPQGLAGSHSVTFLLGPDSPVPSGDLAHSEMLRLPP